MLEINDLKKTFDNGSPALKGVNLKINKGEFVSILGPSGSGKTTLLRTINGLETSSGGEIYFDNQIVNNNTNTVPRIFKNNKCSKDEIDEGSGIKSLFCKYDVPCKISAIITITPPTPQQKNLSSFFEKLVDFFS